MRLKDKAVWSPVPVVVSDGLSLWHLPEKELL
jgi:hypothetical protein